MLKEEILNESFRVQWLFILKIPLPCGRLVIFQRNELMRQLPQLEVKIVAPNVCKHTKHRFIVNKGIDTYE